MIWCRCLIIFIEPEFQHSTRPDEIRCFWILSQTADFLNVLVYQPGAHPLSEFRVQGFGLRNLECGFRVRVADFRVSLLSCRVISSFTSPGCPPLPFPRGLQGYLAHTKQPPPSLAPPYFTRPPRQGSGVWIAGFRVPCAPL